MTVLGGLLSIPVLSYSYPVYKGVPKAIAAFSRASARIPTGRYFNCRLRRCNRGHLPGKSL